MMDRNASGRSDHGPEGARAEWLGAMQSLAEQIQKQQQNSQQMIQELMNTYMQLQRTKNRDTILEQLDRRIRGGS